jgi:hypothetical protein
MIGAAVIIVDVIGQSTLQGEPFSRNGVHRPTTRSPFSSIDKARARFKVAFAAPSIGRFRILLFCLLGWLD